MNLLPTFLHACNRFILKHNVAVVTIVPLTAVFLIVYIVQNLTMNTDTRDMLSEELAWRQLDIQYERLFPHVIDTLILVVEAQSPDEASDSANRLVSRLKQQPELFKSIFHFSSQEFVQSSSLLYLQTDELYQLADQLATYQPFLGQLLNDQSLNNFLSLLIQAIEHQSQGNTIEISPVLKEFLGAIKASNQNDHYLVSWQTLLSDKANEDTQHKDFIIVQPQLDYSSLFPAQDIIEKIRAYAIESGITADKHRRLSLTGPVALAHEEFESVSQTNTIAIILALLLVSILLIIGLGSFKLVLVVLVSLITGLIYTAAFATATIGELNLISIAFAVLYIGLGVDFAIHYCLKYREHTSQSNSVESALTSTINDIGKTLFVCAITTAIGFFSFLVTDYRGVAELGLIAGSGMFISLLMTILFIPAMLKTFGLQAPNKNLRNKYLLSLLRLPERWPNTILIISGIGIALSIWMIPKIQFDYDLLNIQPPENESVITFRQLMADDQYPVMTSVVVAEDKTMASQLDETLSALETVKEVIWLDKFIPVEQDEKLSVIDEMNLLLGDMLAANSKKDYPLATVKQSLQSLHDALRMSANHDQPVYQPLLNELKRLQTRLEQFDENNQRQLIDALENSVFASLPGRMHNLKQGLSSQGLALADLPSSFSRRWLNQQYYLLEIIPAENMSDTENLKRFVSETQSAVVSITGPPIVSIEAGNAVIDAFKLAFLAAFLAVTVLLLLLLQHKRDVVYVLIPLLTASLYTGALCVVFELPLNFANIIALPLLFGIGVDSAIHIVQQNNKKTAGELLLQSSAARAIVISALTTLLSIGNLALSPHLGTASMGKLLVIGIGFALICTLLITPALLARKR